jgi:Mce-associated membrane protein
LLALVALVAVVVLAIFLGLSQSSLSDTQSSLSHEHALDAARTSALATARVDAGELASYDYRNLPAHFKDVENGSDAKFAKKFESTSGALEKVLAQYHAVARASVLNAGVVSVSTSRAQVMLFVDQTVTNSQVTTPTTDRSRILITLVRSGSTWLLDQLEVL